MRQTPNSIKFEICTFLKLTTPIATIVTLMIAKRAHLQLQSVNNAKSFITNLIHIFHFVV